MADENQSFSDFFTLCEIYSDHTAIESVFPNSTRVINPQDLQNMYFFSDILEKHDMKT